MMAESAVEARLTRGVKRLGGLSFKFVSPSFVGVPDRIIIQPDGYIFFVEVKTDTGKLSKRQVYVIDMMRRHNCDVRVCYGPQQVDDLLRDMEGRLKNDFCAT